MIWSKTVTEEDKKNSKGISSESNKQILQLLQEVLINPQGLAEAEYPLRLRKNAESHLEDQTPNSEAPVLPVPESETATGSPAARSSGPPASVRKGKTAAGRQTASAYTGVLYSILINVLLFAVTFIALYLVTLVPGFTRFNRLHFYSDISVGLLELPLWVNLGCTIGAVAVLVRLIINCQRCRLGLIIGIAVSLTALISNSMEGYVGNGIVFGFGTSITCVICLIIMNVKDLGLKDIVRISSVAGLSILAIVGPALHFFAALLIGLLITLCTKIILSVCLLMTK